MDQPNIKQVIGLNTRRLRREKGYSQVEFGTQIGLITGKSWSAQVVSGAESGRREFVVVELIAICQVLQCTIGDLMAANPESTMSITADLNLPAIDVARLSPTIEYALTTSSDESLIAEMYNRLVDSRTKEKKAPVPEPGNSEPYATVSKNEDGSRTLRIEGMGIELHLPAEGQGQNLHSTPPAWQGQHINAEG